MDEEYICSINKSVIKAIDYAVIAAARLMVIHEYEHCSRHNYPDCSWYMEQFDISHPNDLSEFEISLIKSVITVAYEYREQIRDLAINEIRETMREAFAHFSPGPISPQPNPYVGVYPQSYLYSNIYQQSNPYPHSYSFANQNNPFNRY